MQGGSLWVALVAGAWLVTPLQLIAVIIAVVAALLVVNGVGSL
jgi:hypothetical protein